MKHNLRWLMVLPAVALSALASLLLYPLGHRALLLACSGAHRTTESTTDFSRPAYAATFDSCSAEWFPATDSALIVTALCLSVLAAGFVGYRVAPSRRRLSGTVSALLVAGLVVAVFAAGA